jgi:hypothetical protein
MSERKTPVLLRRGPISGNINALLRYREVEDGVLHVASKHDVTADYTALMLEELLDPDSPDIAAILDGVADGEELTEEQRTQVRSFRERLVVVIERHNTRGHGATVEVPL